MTTTKTMRGAGLADGYAHDQTTNAARVTLDLTVPYTAEVEVVGVAPLLFHSWNVEAIEEKAKAAKGSAAKKTDDIESYVYRTPDGQLGIPGKNFAAALIEAARYQQDPRSPRKSARDLVRASVVPLDVVAPFDPPRTEWDYLDRQRVMVQRNGVTRVRPAMLAGWRVAFRVLVTMPQYVPVERLTALSNDAGRLVGLCDFRPTYGRFTVAGVSLLVDD